MISLDYRAVGHHQKLNFNSLGPLGPLHSGVERKFCPIKCCFENLLGIKDQVSAKMSVSECVQQNLSPDQSKNARQLGSWYFVQKFVALLFFLFYIGVP